LLRRKAGGQETPTDPGVPTWLNPEFAKRCQLSERIDRDRFDVQKTAVPHIRSASHLALETPFWQRFFEYQDPGASRLQIETRHPFFDIRVLSFLTALPPLPWCQEKNILKAAGQGMLPEEVRLRPKAPLAGNVLWSNLRDCGPDWWARHFDPAPELSRFVKPEAYPTRAFESPDAMWTALRLVSFNYWLQLGRKSVPADYGTAELM
jgi:asparagine synthase (glutamine-hydrolysing)